jgi:hypothetical protein
MSEDGEAFLDRWSRLKQEQAPEKPAVTEEQKQAKEEPAAVLPPVDRLTAESDFKPFMDARVDTGTRRTALKKLFTDPHYNVADPFEAYSEDYTREEPIPIEMLKTLNHARKLLFDEPEKAAGAAAAPSGPDSAAAQPETPAEDLKHAVGKQDA